MPELQEIIGEAVREAAGDVLRRANELKPLLTEADVLRTLGVGRSTFIQKIQPKLPPLWIAGQKRWHPDAVDAYLRSISGKRKR